MVAKDLKDKGKMNDSDAYWLSKYSLKLNRNQMS